jgi:hypothetical protein
LLHKLKRTRESKVIKHLHDAKEHQRPEKRKIIMAWLYDNNICKTPGFDLP